MRSSLLTAPAALSLIPTAITDIIGVDWSRRSIIPAENGGIEWAPQHGDDLTWLDSYVGQ
jgi:hypothetical protein